MNSNVVGITGGIGCGKTTVTDLFVDKGVPVIDADIVAREVVAPHSPALLTIRNKFGSNILIDDGNLNRALLREIIFENPQHKEWLESLLHPIIRSEIVSQLNDASKNNSFAILSSPLLLETDQSHLVSKIIVIDIDSQTQINRTMSRDNNTKELIQKIIDSQMKPDIRRGKADIIIDNNGNLDNLKEQVNQIHATLKVLFTPLNAR